MWHSNQSSIQPLLQIHGIGRVSFGLFCPRFTSQPVRGPQGDSPFAPGQLNFRRAASTKHFKNLESVEHAQVLHDTVLRVQLEAG
jgi:hypothetical protein